VRHRTCIVPCLVRRHVTQPLGFWARSTVGALSSCGPGQSDAPLTLLLWLLRDTVLHCSLGIVDRWRELAVALLAHWTVRWIIAERALEFPRVAGWHLYGPGAPNTVRCANFQHTQVLCFVSNWVPNLISFLVCVEPYAPIIHEF
jgi:hypothetical protein